MFVICLPGLLAVFGLGHVPLRAGPRIGGFVRPVIPPCFLAAPRFAEAMRRRGWTGPTSASSGRRARRTPSGTTTSSPAASSGMGAARGAEGRERSALVTLQQHGPVGWRTLFLPRTALDT